jgi:hypothetical protein
MADWFQQNAPKGGSWFQQNSPSANKPAGLPEGVDLPSVSAHPAVDLKEPAPTFADNVGGRIKSNAAGLVRPILHPSTILSEAGWVDPSKTPDLISDIRENPNSKGVANAVGDTLTAAAIGGAAHLAPTIAEPVGGRLKTTAGKIIDNTVGLRAKDVSHGAMPGRAYLEGGGGPALSLESLGEKASNIKEKTGTQLRSAYDDAGARGVRIPASNVFDAVAEPIGKLRSLQDSAGGTGVSASIPAYEDRLLNPIVAAEGRGGFTPSELFDEMKQPISKNTRWNDPTMFDLNKVRQQTVGGIGGLLTDAVPETAKLNKIYQGTGRLADRATMRSDTGQSPLSELGRKGAEGAAGIILGEATKHPLLGAIPLLADSVPVRTTLATGMYGAGGLLPGLARGAGRIVPITRITGSSRPKPSPKDDEDR